MLFAKPAPPSLNLALQGGGAHGAFTWGALDALLEHSELGFEGISGTSAGAMNAVVMAHGLMQGGRDGARQALESFWSAIAKSSPIDLTVPAQHGEGIALAPAVKMMMQWAQFFSPDQLNPFDFNPLRNIIADQIDFAALRRHCPVQLFIAATHANSGKLRLFRNNELTVDTLLASACLPTIHRSIIIDGEPYWDGGYSANPAIFPLFYECQSTDILLILLTPIEHHSTPNSAAEIKTRALEISFNAAFLREMRSFAQYRANLGRSWLASIGRLERRATRIKFHLIEAEDFLGGLASDTKLAANTRFFEQLRQQGQQRTQTWLSQHLDSVGKRSSVDVDKLFG